MKVVVLSCILHDMGWSETQEHRFVDKRFEVDEANVARDFIRNHDSGTEGSWTEARIQRSWDAIALHATPSIAVDRTTCCERSCTGTDGCAGGLLRAEDS